MHLYLATLINYAKSWGLKDQSGAIYSPYSFFIRNLFATILRWPASCIMNVQLLCITIIMQSIHLLHACVY